ncbi:uncharacterized protein LOC143741202 isoform X1 [Siphateles boraxobius]|uniref:uncharacterized protein LOC143741202 isoform X1 n=1 Tax=Siphateles boraxobius TaxID=180520 RepID=UPI004062F2A7
MAISALEICYVLLIINQIPQMKSDLAIIAQKTGRSPVEDLDSPFSTFGEVQPTAATAETSAKTQVEVIKGSGVFCQAEAWKPARLATSATAMVWKSNLNGGKPTRGDGEQLVALDQIKKVAIIDATLKKWPATSRGQIGTSINSKLTELRRSTR